MNPLKYYNHIKAKYPNAIVFIETPVSYVTFKHDAEQTARILGRGLMPADIITTGVEKNEIFDVIAELTTAGL